MKKLLAILLACLMLVSLLAGCGSTGSSETASEKEEAPKADTSSKDAEEANGAEEDEGGDAEEAFTRFDELQEVNYWIRTWADYEGRTEVWEEINKILEEKINVHVNPTFLSTDFNNQLVLALAAGENVDLTMVPWAFASFTSQNVLQPLNDLIPEYAPWIAENMADYLPAMSIDGNIYAVTVNREMNTSQYLIWRKDIVQALGLEDKMKAVDSWTGLHDILAEIRDRQDELPDDLKTPIIFGAQNGNGSMVAYQGVDWSADKAADNKAYDYLGCDYIAVIDGKVIDNMTADHAVAMYDRMYDWYQEGGLISKDAATTSEYSDTCMANGQYFCYFSNAEYGAAAAKSNNTGRDLDAKVWVNIGLTTSYVSCFGMGIPNGAENPEAAMAVMDQLMSNPDICNLNVWGIRGRDYELDDTGCAYRLDDRTYEALEYFQGNQFLAYAPQQEEGAAFRDHQYEDCKNGQMSPYFGLAIDNTEIANELTAIKNVIDKYYPTIACGQVKADTVIDDFKAELEAAGMPKILAFYQEAVDNWDK